MPRGKQRAHADEEPAEGLDLAHVVAKNMKAYRQLRDLTQDELAERMAGLGLGWTGQVVGFAERFDRVIGVNEIAGLAVALGVTPSDLMDPTGPAGDRRELLYVGAGMGLESRRAGEWARDRVVVEAEWEAGQPTKAVHRGRTDDDAHELLKIAMAEAAETVEAQRKAGKRPAQKGRRSPGRSK